MLANVKYYRNTLSHRPDAEGLPCLKKNPDKYFCLLCSIFILKLVGTLLYTASSMPVFVLLLQSYDLNILCIVLRC